MGLGMGILRKEFYPSTYVLLYLLWHFLSFMWCNMYTHKKKNANFTQMVCNNFLFDYSVGYRTAFSDAANHTTPWLKFLEDLINFVSSVVLTWAECQSTHTPHGGFENPTTAFLGILQADSPP